ncbi:MAG TPA: class I SAM-dependent methyltransferase [Thermoanaerobaculia bacterium]
MLGPLRRLVYRHWQKFHGVRRRELAVLSGYLDPRPGDRILDLGSGKGAYCGTLARKGSRPTGVDPSLSALAIAHTWVDGAGCFVGASGESLPLKDGAFDKAVSVCVLEHTSDPARVLAELARVTKPGGTLAISVDAMNSPHVTEEHRRHHAAEYKCHRFFDEKDLRALLSAAGFETLETRYLFGGKLSVAILRWGSRFHFRGPFVLAFPLIYPLLLADEVLPGRRGSGMMLAARARKRGSPPR